MATHSSMLAWKIPWTEEPTYSPWGHQESDTTERLCFHFSLSCTGERNGNPLQYSCLENSRDRGAWWAAVYGITQSRTRLKRLSSSSTGRICLVSKCICGCRQHQALSELNVYLWPALDAYHLQINFFGKICPKFCQAALLLIIIIILLLIIIFKFNFY